MCFEREGVNTVDCNLGNLYSAFFLTTFFWVISMEPYYYHLIGSKGDSIFRATDRAGR